LRYGYEGPLTENVIKKGQEIAEKLGFTICDDPECNEETEKIIDSFKKENK
jgi:hypothetical protein